MDGEAFAVDPPLFSQASVCCEALCTRLASSSDGC